MIEDPVISGDWIFFVCMSLILITVTHYRNMNRLNRNDRTALFTPSQSFIITMLFWKERVLLGLSMP